MKEIIILLISLTLFNCAKDDCVKLSTKEKVIVGNSYKSLASKTANNGVPHDTWDNPMILTETLRDRPWFPYDSIHNIVHACGKFDSIEQVWKAKTWVGFPQDITIRKDKRLLLSTVNCIIEGSILGEGTIELKGCASTLIVNGDIAPTITQSVEEGCSIIINKPLGDYSLPNEKYIMEVPCNFVLPQKIFQDGIWWYYREYDGAGVRLDAGTYKGKL